MSDSDGLRGRTARRPAERAAARADRRQDRARSTSSSGRGLTRIEAASFVSPKWVPQMADAAEVHGRHRRAAGRALRRAHPEPARASRRRGRPGGRGGDLRLGLGGVQPEEHQLLDRREPRALRAGRGGGARGRAAAARLRLLRHRLPLRRPDRAGGGRLGHRGLLALGCYEVSLGDTIGRGTPETVDRLLARLTRRSSPARLAGHFHDTGGRALDNVEVALGYGLRTFDSAIGGPRRLPLRPRREGQRLDRPPRPDARRRRLGDRPRPRRARARRGLHGRPRREGGAP